MVCPGLTLQGDETWQVDSRRSDKPWRFKSDTRQNSTFWIQTQVAQVSGISCWLWNPIYCCPLCSRLWSHLWLAHCVSKLGRIPWQEDSCLSLQEVWTWDPKGERTVPSTAGRTRKRSMFITMPRTGTYTILYYLILMLPKDSYLFVKHLLHRGRYSICRIHFVSIDIQLHTVMGAGSTQRTEFRHMAPWRWNLRSILRRHLCLMCRLCFLFIRYLSRAQPELFHSMKWNTLAFSWKQTKQMHHSWREKAIQTSGSK